MAIVASAGLGDEGAPVFHVERIAEVRLPNGSVFVGCLVGPAHAGVAKPFGQWMLLIVRHETNCQRLMMLPGFLESGVNNFPANAIRSGLKFTPEPAAVSNGGIRKH